MTIGGNFVTSRNAAESFTWTVAIPAGATVTAAVAQVTQPTLVMKEAWYYKVAAIEGRQGSFPAIGQ